MRPLRSPGRNQCSGQPLRGASALKFTKGANMIGKLTTIMLIVKDMDRSVAFYRDIVGLKLEMHTPDWSSLSAGNITLGLHPESQHAKGTPTLGCTFGF